MRDKPEAELGAVAWEPLGWVEYQTEIANRICFRWENDYAEDVEFTDYH